MKDSVIVACGRSAIAKAPKGTLKNTRPDEFAAQVVKGVLAKAPGVALDQIEDFILGCAFPEAEQGLNTAAVVALRAGLPDSVPAQTVNRFCASGLQSIAHAANAIKVGQNEIVLAGGMESMSMVPMGGNVLAPNPYLMKNYPQAHVTMGITAENVAERYGVTRKEQDEFSLESHLKAAQAQSEGRFDEQIIPVDAVSVSVDERGFPKAETRAFQKDEGIRSDVSMEGLTKLRTVFKARGSVTAGNSSQTSDGAAAVLLMSAERAKAEGVPALARVVSFASVGVAPELMGIGPIEAIPKALKLAGLSLSDIGLIELNEAFASQSIACIRELGLDPEIVNVNGGAIALGHPLGCTGSLLTVKLLHEMRARGVKYGIVSMCVGGGMGSAAIFELLES